VVSYSIYLGVIQLHRHTSPCSPMKNEPPPIPRKEKYILLPPEDLSVADFLCFPLPLISAAQTFQEIPAFFSQESPNTSNVEFLQSKSLPHPSIIAEINAVYSKAVEARVLSIVYAHDTHLGSKFCPLWIVSFWNAVLGLRSNERKLWLEADTWLDAQRMKSLPSRHSVDAVCATLQLLPWTRKLRFFDHDPTADLIPYLSFDWLTMVHQSQLLKLLEVDVKSSIEWRDCLLVVPSTTHQSMLAHYHSHEDETYWSTSIIRWLRDLGVDLSSSTHDALLTIVHIHGNHWIGAIFDFLDQSISYADPLGGKIPSEISACHLWWVKNHTEKVFTIKVLQCTTQIDGHSCGLLAPTALVHKYFPTTHLLINPKMIPIARMDAFMAVANHHLRTLVHIMLICSDVTVY
jgi:hypothetical protein